VDLLEKYMIDIRQSHRKREKIEQLINEIDDHLNPLLQEIRESDNIHLMERVVEYMPRGYHKQLIQHHMMKLEEKNSLKQIEN
jgi:t-SNARE complex subunit (syntaxin)